MLNISILKTQTNSWDEYVKEHSEASVYHISSFKTVIEKTYNHKSYYLFAHEGSQIIGVLPLFHIKSIFLGNSLVSLPFCDYGGIIANNPYVNLYLLNYALAISKHLKCDYIELRHAYPLLLPDKIEFCCFRNLISNKVRLKLFLPESSEELFKSFSSKLRSQIRKPQKEGCTVRIGGIELLNDFYDVFSSNMKILGSPVHSKKIISNMLNSQSQSNRLFLVYHNLKPVACSFVAGFRDTLVNPWASFDRASRKTAPNMLLYWEMLKYSIESGYRYFDFGRSTIDEGTYKFKLQWGAQPEPLFWYQFSENENVYHSVENTKKDNFIRIWRSLPLTLTNLLGPVIRRQLHFLL